jgi:nicotinamide riboside kinase
LNQRFETGLTATSKDELGEQSLAFLRSLYKAIFEKPKPGDKILHLLGSGANGKSTLVQLIAAALGNYFRRISIPNSVTFDDILPSLANSYRCRIVDFSNDNTFTDREVEKLMKLVNHKLKTRQLYTSYAMRLKYHLLVVSNEPLVNVPESVLETTRLENVFVKEPESSVSYKDSRQMARDTDMFRRVEDECWGPYLMSLILTHGNSL